MYCCRRDKKCITMISTAHPGHADGTVKRKSKDPTTGSLRNDDVPIPSTVKEHNKYMGGVDISDQYILYHQILRQTKRYWKTLLYHLTNAYLLYKWLKMEDGGRTCTESEFRDALVLQMLDNFGTGTSFTTSTTDTANSFQIRHGSTPSSMQSRCIVCVNKATRFCPDCDYTPYLCQYTGRDCHQLWHSPSHAQSRSKWFRKRRKSIATALSLSRGTSTRTKRGRPPGRKNKQKRITK